MWHGRCWRGEGGGPCQGQLTDGWYTHHHQHYCWCLPRLALTRTQAVNRQTESSIYQELSDLAGAYQRSQLYSKLFSFFPFLLSNRGILFFKSNFSFFKCSIIWSRISLSNWRVMSQENVSTDHLELMTLPVLSLCVSVITLPLTNWCPTTLFISLHPTPSNLRWQIKFRVWSSLSWECRKALANQRESLAQSDRNKHPTMND